MQGRVCAYVHACVKGGGGGVRAWRAMPRSSPSKRHTTPPPHSATPPPCAQASPPTPRSSPSTRRACSLPSPLTACLRLSRRWRGTPGSWAASASPPTPTPSLATCTPTWRTRVGGVGWVLWGVCCGCVCGCLATCTPAWRTRVGGCCGVGGVEWVVWCGWCGVCALPGEGLAPSLARQPPATHPPPPHPHITCRRVWGEGRLPGGGGVGGRRRAGRALPPGSRGFHRPPLPWKPRHQLHVPLHGWVGWVG